MSPTGGGTGRSAAATAVKPAHKSKKAVVRHVQSAIFRAVSPGDWGTRASGVSAPIFVIARR